MVAGTRRAGHSLPELIVAVTFLATTAAAVGSMSVVGARRTLDAVGQQEAVRLAEAVLDSLAAAPAVSPGGTLRGVYGIRWAPEGAAGIRVTVTPTGGAPVALRGRRVPAVPVLPDAEPDSVDRFVAGPVP